MKKAIITIFAVTVSVGLATIHKSYTAETPVKKEPEVAAVGTPEKAVAMLNELIAKNSAFSVKIAHHELPIKANLWQRKGQLKLPTNIPWETFKRNVHQFGVDLHALLEKDEKGVYYHIEALRKDAAVYNALSQMNQKLPKEQKNGAKESVLKIGKLPTQGLISSINLYAAAFYQQKLLEQIKTFFKGFEERAKGLRSKEEEAQKTAELPAPTTSFDEFDYTDTGMDMDMDFADTSMDFGETETDFDVSTAKDTSYDSEDESPRTEADFDTDEIDRNRN